MKIALVSTHDMDGGAARAAYNLYSNLSTRSESVKYFVKNKYVDDENVIRIKENLSLSDQNLRNLLKYEISKYNTNVSNTLFGISYTNANTFPYQLFQEFDIINLHWITNFLSPQVIYKLSKGKHIVWTMHDQAAFTGGCHYSADCLGYKSNCLECKQVKFPKGKEFPYLYFLEKMNFLSNIPITFVVASSWMESCIKQSKLFSSHRIEYIPYSVDTQNTFKPIDKELARNKLGIPEYKITILFGADNGNDKRKGFHLLLEAFRLLINKPLVSKLIAMDKIQIVILGKPNAEINQLGIPSIFLARINDNDKLNYFYNSGDFLVLPSIEDNLPLIMLEAISAGIPVIAFDTGGMKDIIKSNTNGSLVPLNNIVKLAENIAQYIELVNSKNISTISHSSREYAKTFLNNSIESSKYMNLFENLMQEEHAFIEPKQDSNFEIYKAQFKRDYFIMFINLVLLKIINNLYHFLFSEQIKRRIRNTVIFRFLIYLFRFTKA